MHLRNVLLAVLLLCGILGATGAKGACGTNVERAWGVTDGNGRLKAVLFDVSGAISGVEIRFMNGNWEIVRSVRGDTFHTSIRDISYNAENIPTDALLITREWENGAEVGVAYEYPRIPGSTVRIEVALPGCGEVYRLEAKVPNVGEHMLYHLPDDGSRVYIPEYYGECAVRIDEPRGITDDRGRLKAVLFDVENGGEHSIPIKEFRFQFLGANGEVLREVSGSTVARTVVDIANRPAEYLPTDRIVITGESAHANRTLEPGEWARIGVVYSYPRWPGTAIGVRAYSPDCEDGYSILAEVPAVGKMKIFTLPDAERSADIPAYAEVNAIYGVSDREGKIRRIIIELHNNMGLALYPEDVNISLSWGNSQITVNGLHSIVTDKNSMLGTELNENFVYVASDTGKTIPPRGSGWYGLSVPGGIEGGQKWAVRLEFSIPKVWEKNVTVSSKLEKCNAYRLVEIWPETEEVGKIVPEDVITGDSVEKVISILRRASERFGSLAEKLREKGCKGAADVAEAEGANILRKADELEGVEFVEKDEVVALAEEILRAVAEIRRSMGVCGGR